jgi:hypothetical protein
VTTITGTFTFTQQPETVEGYTVTDSDGPGTTTIGFPATTVELSTVTATLMREVFGRAIHHENHKANDTLDAVKEPFRAQHASDHTDPHGRKNVTEHRHKQARSEKTTQHNKHHTVTRTQSHHIASKSATEHGHKQARNEKAQHNKHHNTTNTHFHPIATKHTTTATVVSTEIRTFSLSDSLTTATEVWTLSPHGRYFEYIARAEPTADADYEPLERRTAPKDPFGQLTHATASLHRGSGAIGLPTAGTIGTTAPAGTAAGHIRH